MYWTLNLVLNQLFCFVAVYLYNTYSEDDVPSFEPFQTLVPNNSTFSTTIQESTSSLPLLETVIGLFLISMTSFGIFLRLIKPGYIKTFFDTRSGNRFLCEKFNSSVTGAAKFDIFGSHKSKIQGHQYRSKRMVE